jgi:hypothetical protein
MGVSFVASVLVVVLRLHCEAHRAEAIPEISPAEKL